MAKKQFKSESKRLLDLMIHSIYTHREIFLRELLSNASDAIDKIYYRALTDEAIVFDQSDYYIRIDIDKEARTLKLTDTGIGMTKEELEDNLGVIAKSGSFDFKKENEVKDGFDIIGQFGVGFYSAFMVADVVSVVTKALGSEEAWKWESKGADGYTIDPAEKDTVGTEITLTLKENTEDEQYDEYLSDYRLRALVKKYSDFIRYPIKMEISSRRLKEGSENEYEEYAEEQTINSMVPIWRKNKSELTEEDYNNFYAEKHYGFDKPLRHIHVAVDGAVSYNAILYIPEKMPYDFYTRDYEKGLELYSRGVMIMNKCPDLLPDHYSFVKGMTDSEDLSLNISREILQHDRQLKLIAKNLRHKIKSELTSLLKEEREKYELFFQSFGRQLKYGIYTEYGSNKEELEDLLLFGSSFENKMTTLAEYVSRMKEEQKYIYFASGESKEAIAKMPQIERLSEQGFEILYFTEDIDEFAIRMMMTYQDKEFRSVSDSDLGLPEDENKEDGVSEDAESTDLLTAMKETLGDKVKDVRFSKRLKTHPVCFTTEGGLSIEMEKLINAMPSDEHVKAQKVLEINRDHEISSALKAAMETDREKLAAYTNLLYNQALLLEGLSVEDPVEFSNLVCKLMK